MIAQLELAAIVIIIIVVSNYLYGKFRDYRIRREIARNRDSVYRDRIK